MRRRGLVVIVLAVAALQASAAPAAFTHYVVANLHLRASGSLGAAVLTTLPRYTAIAVVEQGAAATIDGIAASWIKVASQTGYTGWCFSGYVKSVEADVADTIAAAFAERKSGTYPASAAAVAATNAVSAEAVTAGQGYYVQQSPRHFQGSGHAPEILQLAVFAGRVFLREVDVVNGAVVTRSEIVLTPAGSTYAHGRTRLTSSPGGLAVIYLEHIPDQDWLGTGEFAEPYTFAAPPGALAGTKVHRLTSDYLKTFVGRYVVDSVKVLTSENDTVSDGDLSGVAINIGFSEQSKSLEVPAHELLDICEPGNLVGDYHLSFVETNPDEPFFWTYGLGVGFTEDRFFFYKGGIAFTHEDEGYDFDQNHHVTKRHSLKYAVFFKKTS
jgi:hypothetical protein